MYKTQDELREHHKDTFLLVIFSLFSMLVFALLAKNLASHKLTGFDSEITRIILDFRGPVMTKAMKLITSLGSAAAITLLGILVIYIIYRLKKHFLYSGMLLVAATGGWLLEATLKSILHRPRPDIPHLVTASGYSFPSGHATISIIVYGFLGYLLSLYFHEYKYRYLITLNSTIIILLIGISRIYLGVHYPSDVLAGFATGGFWLAICILITEHLKQRIKTSV